MKKKQNKKTKENTNWTDKKNKYKYNIKEEKEAFKTSNKTSNKTRALKCCYLHFICGK